MRTINVITIKNNFVENIESFQIEEEQLSEVVVAKAEEVFSEKVVFLEGNDGYLEGYLKDKFYESKTGTTVSLVWS